MNLFDKIPAMRRVLRHLKIFVFYFIGIYKSSKVCPIWKTKEVMAG